MSKKKTIEELTEIELVEDLEHYIIFANHQTPSFVDPTFIIILKYITELKKRLKS